MGQAYDRKQMAAPDVPASPCLFRHIQIRRHDLADHRVQKVQRGEGHMEKPLGRHEVFRAVSV